MSKNTISIRELASIKGKLEATRPANSYAQLWCKRLEIEKTQALKQNRFDYEAKITLSGGCREDLSFAARGLPGSSAPVRPIPYDLKFTSDASNKGWGIFDPASNVRGGGRWSKEEEEEHINILELKGAFFALRSFCKNVRDKHVRLMSDSTTVVACVNRQGSTKVRLNDITREMWHFAIARGIYLSSAHLKGVLNVESDEAS